MFQSTKEEFKQGSGVVVLELGNKFQSTKEEFKPTYYTNPTHSSSFRFNPPKRNLNEQTDTPRKPAIFVSIHQRGI